MCIISLSLLYISPSLSISLILFVTNLNIFQKYFLSSFPNEINFPNPIHFEPKINHQHPATHCQFERKKKQREQHTFYM